MAICDDLQEEVEKLEALVREYLLEKGIDAEVLVFSHPDKLLQYCEPDSKVAIFKNAGHLVNMDVPGEFNKTVLEFLNAL